MEAADDNEEPGGRWTRRLRYADVRSLCKANAHKLDNGALCVDARHPKCGSSSWIKVAKNGIFDSTNAARTTRRLGGARKGRRSINNQPIIWLTSTSYRLLDAINVCCQQRALSTAIKCGLKGLAQSLISSASHLLRRLSAVSSEFVVARQIQRPSTHNQQLDGAYEWPGLQTHHRS